MPCGYNAQASVDIATHLIVAHHVTQHTNDKKEIEPALAKLGQLPDCLGTVENLLADTGYFSQANVEACVDATIKPYLAQKRQSHNPLLETRFQHEPEKDEPPPLPPVEAMTHRLATKAGKALYGKRKSSVETVFGTCALWVSLSTFWASGNFSFEAWNPSKVNGIWSVLAGI